MYWELTTREVDDTGIIDVLQVNVFSQSKGELKSVVVKLLAKGKKNILINLAKARYIDSSGIGELVGCQMSALDNSARVVLVVTGRIRDVFVLTRLNEFIMTFNNEDEAMESFQK